MVSPSRLILSLVGGAMGCMLGLGNATAQTPAEPSYPSLPPPHPSPSAPPELETGGLTPPPTSSAPPGHSETFQQLERAEREDAGRGLEFVWLNVEAGYEYISLQTFEANSVVDAELVEDSGSAFAFGVGAGVRVVFLTLGARFRLAQFSDWDLWTLNGELGLHIPLGTIEPSFTFSAGYASLGAFSLDGATGGFDIDSVDVHGFNARLGAGLDWYVNPLLSLGAQGTAELLALWRDARAQPTPAAGNAEAAEIYGRDGDGIGLGITVTGVVGLHF